MSALSNNLNIREFFAWWVRELASIFPGKKTTAANSVAQGITADLNRSESSLIWDDVDKTVSCGKRFSAETAIEKYRSALYENKKLAVNICNIRVSEKHILRKTITLPLATEENINNVISYEMDRYTPFKNEDVYFDVKIQERNKAENKLTILLSVIRRSLLDKVLQFASELEMSIGTIYAESQTEDESIERLAFIDGMKGARNQGKKSSVNKFLGVLLVILSLCALSIPIIKNYWNAHRYEAELANIEGEVGKAREVLKQYKEIKKNADYLQTLNANNTSAIELLNDITRVTPDDTSLIRFSLEESVVRLQGLSSSASNLLSILDSSESFSEVRFVAPVTQDAKTGRENFTLEIKLPNKGQDK